MEKPILFNTEMVQAILDGRKTSTRRIAKYDFKNIYGVACANGKWNETYGKNIPNNLIEWYIREKAKRPYQVGDTLWVRETFTSLKIKKPVGAIPSDFKDIRYLYKADNVANSDGSVIKWRPSIHMPRSAARIFLKVTDVKAEKVQDITSHEAIQEGVGKIILDNKNPLYKKTYERAVYDRKTQDWYAGATEAFAALWDSLYEKKGYGWKGNPWVWVIEFKRISKEE